MTPAFARYGPAQPESPVILSVPHAGRDYPPELAAAARVPMAALRVLEDRHVDALALAAHRAGGARETMLVATRARAWIDLNRGEADRDPKLEDGLRAGGPPLSAKVRSGLGLVPRRAGSAGELWRGKLPPGAVEARIASDHRPYHAAVAEALAAAQARFGVAVLIDVHSMPPLGTGEGIARVVIGDRFARASAPPFPAAIERVLLAHRIRFAVNIPYSGGHVLERHGAPTRGVHAIQIEFDRRLYLDAALDAPGAGMAATARLLRAMIDAVADEALAMPLAAE